MPSHALREIVARDRKSKDFPGRTAARVRGAIDLGEDEPIRDICGLLEARGIKVRGVPVASPHFFGLSVAPSDGGPAIVVNTWDRISVERWIFTAAHELGHLVLHLADYDVGKTDESEEHEVEANAFASAFRASFPEGLASHEPEHLSKIDFTVDRLQRLVRVGVERGVISLSRGGEILRFPPEDMRELAASWAG